MPTKYNNDFKIMTENKSQHKILYLAIHQLQHTGFLKAGFQTKLYLCQEPTGKYISPK